MNDRGASPIAVQQPVGPTRDAGHDLVATFNGLRDELISTLWFIVGNRDDALDVAQDAFVKCWRSRPSLDGVVDLRAWIFRVAMNTAKDMRKSAWRRKSRPFADEGEAMIVDAVAEPAEYVGRAEELERLRVALSDLRDEEKEVFLLRQNGELTYEQIAELRDTPVGTIKTQMRSALMKLRKVLAEV